MMRERCFAGRPVEERERAEIKTKRRIGLRGFKQLRKNPQTEKESGIRKKAIPYEAWAEQRRQRKDRRTEKPKG